MGCVVAVLFGWSVALGCSTFSGTDPAPGGDDGQAEAAPAPADGGVVDAAAPDGGPASFSCTGIDAAFCDDFEAAQLGSAWDRYVNEGGIIDLVPGHSSSPLHAFHSFVPNHGTSGPQSIGYASLVHVQPRDLQVPVVIVDADLRLDAVAKPGAGIITALTLTFSSSRVIFFAVSGDGAGALVVADNTVDASAKSDSGATPIFSIPPLHTWFHVRIEADLVKATMTLYIDGLRRLENVRGIASTDAQYTVAIGFYAAPADGISELATDNVVITTR